MDAFKALLGSEFAPFGVLTELQLELLEQHYELLLRWNKKINLTRIVDLLPAVQLHYCESLYLANSLPHEQLRIADVGSGAGFPGIPVAIYRPDCSVVLVESDQRKAVFLREATRGLSNVSVLAQRAEAIKEDFDWIISRAVRPEDVLGLKSAKNFAILGVEGEKLPWGEGRSLLIKNA